MTEEPQDESALVDAFAARLREADPPEVDAVDAVRRALAQARGTSSSVVPLRAAPRPWYRRVPSYVWAAAAMTAIAWGVYTWVPERRAPEAHVAVPMPRWETTEIEGGHAVVAASDAAWSTRIDGDTTRVELERGEALFVVEPLEGRQFIVQSGPHRVAVVGTVFLVRAGAAFEVEVLEGEVEADGQPQRPDGEVSGWAPTLTARGLRAAREREARSEVEMPTAPNVDHRPSPEPPPSLAPSTAPAPSRVPSAEVIQASLAARQYAHALAEADAALEARPQRSVLHRLRGDALRGVGRRPAALSSYREAVRRGRGPERASVGLVAARLAVELGRQQDARELLDESGALFPDSPVRAAAQALSAELVP
ncbi:MAG: FecR domain-containing protein [Sandaracinaceae bacterium]